MICWFGRWGLGVDLDVLAGNGEVLVLLDRGSLAPGGSTVLG